MIDENEKIIFYDEDVYLNLGANKKDLSQQSYVPGTLKICENRFGPYLVWELDERELLNETDGEWDVISNESSNVVTSSTKYRQSPVKDTKFMVDNANIDVIDADAKVDAIAQTINNQINTNITKEDNQSHVQGSKKGKKTVLNINYSGLKVIRFELYDIKCYRSKTGGSEGEPVPSIPQGTVEGKDDTWYAFILKDGSTYPPFQFTSHEKSEKFVECLLKYLEIKRSYKESNMYIVKDHRAIALEKSFNELNLFSGKAEDFVSKFMKDPYTTTFNGFSKVAQFVYDTLTIPPEGGDSSNGGDISAILNQMISNNVDVTQGESGFQMVNCSELPPRPDVVRSEPLNSREWSTFFDEESGGKLKDPLGIKSRIFRGGVSENIRSDVWKYQLGYFPWDSTSEERMELKKIKADDYFRIKLQWKTVTEEQEKNFTKLRERKSLIEKDVHRTDRTHPFFHGSKNMSLTLSYDILMTYGMYNFDVGYVQGMSDLLTPILVVMENEVDAFWSFVGYMERLKQNFYLEQDSMKLQLSHLYTLLSFVNPTFATYLDKHESGNLYFCFRWLLILFKREFSFTDTMRLWEVFWTDLPCKNFHLLFCLAILEEEEHTIVENKFGLTEILKHINDIANTIDLDKMLKRAEGIYYQIANCPDLPTKISNILGLESKGISGITIPS